MRAPFDPFLLSWPQLITTLLFLQAIHDFKEKIMKLEMVGKAA